MAAHTPQGNRDFLERHQINMVYCPPCLLDLKPTERMWWMHKRTHHKLFPKMATIVRAQEELERFCGTLNVAWRRIPVPCISLKK